MYTYLKEHNYYEDLYDHHTVEDARRSMKYYDSFYDELQTKLPKDETFESPGNAFILNVFYMQTVGDELLNRYENRDTRISEWMARDEEKDERLANTRLTEEPICQHCKKQGLRITDKSLLHRVREADIDDSELLLFTLSCSHCKKNSAYWEDGVAWEITPNLCPKCHNVMTSKTARSKHTITFIYSCSSCHHSYKKSMDFSVKKDESDPDFEKDRSHYCLHDAEFRDRLFTIRHDFLEMVKFGQEWKEKEDNKHIYDAMKEMKKPKIAELAPLLQPVLQKAGYIEFSLDKLEMGKNVFVGFNCLDAKTDRNDYDSRKTLEKLLNRTLDNTNWRLTSDGVSYRLGYLSGRLRAYEGEDNLKQLILKSNILMKLKNADSQSRSDPENQFRIKGKNGEDIIL